MDRFQLSVIRRHWENYLGTSMNLLYDGPEFQAVASDNIEKPPYNQATPKSMEAELFDPERLKSASRPVLHGEKEFIEEFREEKFPDTDLERRDHWMEFNGVEPEEREFEELEFKWIDEEDTADYLNVLQKVFGPPDSYIDLHRNPVKRYGKEVFRLVAYREAPRAIGEIRLNGGDAFIYSLSTLEEEQGKGIGTEVLRRLVSKADERGADRIFLMVEDSQGLLEFYRHRGFEVVFSVVCYSGGSWDEMFR